LSRQRRLDVTRVLPMKMPLCASSGRRCPPYGWARMPRLIFPACPQFARLVSRIPASAGGTMTPQRFGPVLKNRITRAPAAGVFCVVEGGMMVDPTSRRVAPVSAVSCGTCWLQHPPILGLQPTYCCTCPRQGLARPGTPEGLSAHRADVIGEAPIPHRGRLNNGGSLNRPFLCRPTHTEKFSQT
jgi:hypothetical protein